MKIVVSNLSSKTTGANLKALFGKFGTVTSVHIPATAASKRIGVVVMKERAEGRQAILMLNNTRLHLKIITVKETLPELATPVIRLFITNLSPAARDQDLYGLFATFGSVVSAVIPPDMFGQQSGGCGYVEMSRKEDGIKAQEELNNTEFMGQEIEVRVIPSGSVRR